MVMKGKGKGEAARPLLWDIWSRREKGSGLSELEPGLWRVGEGGVWVSEVYYFVVLAIRISVFRSSDVDCCGIRTTCICNVNVNV